MNTLTRSFFWRWTVIF